MPEYPDAIWNAIDELQREGSIPEHVAIIMDGNGRWADANGVTLSEGHREGVKSVRAIADLCGEIQDVSILTLYAFSTENWSRSDEEIETLFDLLVEWLQKEVDRMISQNVRFDTIGDTSVFPERVREELEKTRQLTEDNEEFLLNLAINYGGRNEIVRATREICKRVLSGELTPEQIDEELFGQFLDTGELPDPDLLIRTSGEERISNFLLWQIAYSEIYVTDILWPDFRESEFLDALYEYQTRERRFGSRPNYSNEASGSRSNQPVK